MLQVAGLVIAPELAQRRLVQLKQNLARPLGFGMSKHRVLSLEPQLRPEWRGQDGQSETKQPDH